MGRTRINSTATAGANKVQLKEIKNEIVDTNDHQIDTPIADAAPRTPTTRRSLTFSKDKKTKTVQNKIVMETEAVVVVPAENNNRVVGRTRSRRSAAAAATSMQNNLIINNDKQNNNKEKILDTNNSTAVATATTNIDLDSSSSSSFNKTKINLNKIGEEEEEEDGEDHILTKSKSNDNYVLQLENDPNVVSVIEIFDETYIDDTTNDNSTEKPSSISCEDGGSTSTTTGTTRDDGSSPATTVMSIIDEDSQATSNCSALMQDNIECSQYYVEIVDSVSQDDFVQLKTVTNNRASPNIVPEGITIPNKVNQYSGTYQQEEEHGELIVNINDTGSSSCSDVAVKNHIQNFNLQNSTSADSESLTDSLQSNPDPPIKILRTYQNKRKAKLNRPATDTIEKSLSNEPKPSEFCLNAKINIEDNSESGSSNDRQIVGKISPIEQQPLNTSLVENTERRRSQRKKIIRYDVRDLLNKGRKGNRNSIVNKSESRPIQANVTPVSQNNSNDGEESTSDISRHADSPQVFKGFSDSECSKMSPIIVNEQLRNNLDESSNSSGSLKFGLLQVAGRRTNSPKIAKNLFSNLQLNLENEKANTRSKQKLDNTTELVNKNVENSKRFTRTYLRNRENGKMFSDDKDNARSSPVNIVIPNTSKEDKPIGIIGKLKEDELKLNEIKTVTEKKIIDKNNVVTVLEEDKLNKVKTAKNCKPIDNHVEIVKDVTNSIKEDKLECYDIKSVKVEPVLKDDKLKDKKEKKKGPISKDIKSKDIEIQTEKVQAILKKENKRKKQPDDNQIGTVQSQAILKEEKDKPADSQVKTVEKEAFKNESKLTDIQNKVLNEDETSSQENKLDDNHFQIHSNEKRLKDPNTILSLEKAKTENEEKSPQIKLVKTDRITRQCKPKVGNRLKALKKGDNNIISKEEEKPACNQTVVIVDSISKKEHSDADNRNQELGGKLVLKDDPSKDKQTENVQLEKCSNEDILNITDKDTSQDDKSKDNQLDKSVDKKLDKIEDNNSSSVKDNILNKSDTILHVKKNVVPDLEKQQSTFNVKHFQNNNKETDKKVVHELNNIKHDIMSNVRKLRNSRLKSTPSFEVCSLKILDNKNQEISKKITRKMRAQLDFVDNNKDSTLPPKFTVLEDSCSPITLNSSKTDLIEKRKSETEIENTAATAVGEVNLIEDINTPEKHVVADNEISSLSTNKTNNNVVCTISGNLGNDSTVEDNSTIDIMKSNIEIADSLLSAYDGVEISTEEQSDNILATEIVIDNEDKNDLLAVQNEEIIVTEKTTPHTTVTVAEQSNTKTTKTGAATGRKTTKKKDNDIKKPKKNNVKTFKIVQSTKNKKKTVINNKMNSVKKTKGEIVQKDKKIKTTNKIIKNKLEKNSNTKRKIKNILKKNKTSPKNLLTESLVKDKADKEQKTTSNKVVVPFFHVTGDSEEYIECLVTQPAPKKHPSEGILKKVPKKKRTTKASIAKTKKTGDIIKKPRKKKIPLNKNLLSVSNISDIINQSNQPTPSIFSEKCDNPPEHVVGSPTTKPKKQRNTNKLTKKNVDKNQKAENEKNKMKADKEDVMNSSSLSNETMCKVEEKSVEIIKKIMVEEEILEAVVEDKTKQSKTNEIFTCLPEVCEDGMINCSELPTREEKQEVVTTASNTTGTIQSKESKELKISKNPDDKSDSCDLRTENKRLKPLSDISDSNTNSPLTVDQQQPEDKLIKRPYVSDSSSSSAFSDQNQDNFSSNINETFKSKNKSKTKKSEETLSRKEKLNTSITDSDNTKSRNKKPAGRKAKNESPQKPTTPTTIPEIPDNAISDIKLETDKPTSENIEIQLKSCTNETSDLVIKNVESNTDTLKAPEPNKTKSFNLNTNKGQKEHIKNDTTLLPAPIESLIFFDSKNKTTSLEPTEGTLNSPSKVNFKGKLLRENRTSRWDSPKSVKEMSSINVPNLEDNPIKEANLQNIDKSQPSVEKIIDIIKDTVENSPTLECENVIASNETSSSYLKESSEKIELFGEKPDIKLMKDDQHKADIRPLKDDQCSQDTYKNDENSDSHQPAQLRDESDSSMDSNIRRSHRIKTISKTKPQSVGRGLVKDRERFSLKDDNRNFSADKIHTTITKNQTLTKATDLINKINMELKDIDRLGQFNVIKENEYKCERVISKEAKKMVCDCFLTADEADRGELGCGEDCLNRLLMIECGPKCIVADRCTNRRFQRNVYAICKVFRTEKKGYGLMAEAAILPGEFIMEYVGEVLNGKQFEKRAGIYSQDKNKHYYFMALRSDAIIDATGKGNISRFINHSCDPNAETQKWTVNGELRIGFFSKKRIYPGEEITFDYQFQRYGKEAQKCYCESSNCRGWIGEEPDSEEEEEEEEDEDEVSSSGGESDLEQDLEKEKNLEPETTVLEYDIEKPEKIIVESTEIMPETISVKDSLTEPVPDIQVISKPEPGISVKSLADINKERPVTAVKAPKPPLSAEEKKKRVLQKLKLKREQRFKQQLFEDPDLEDEIGSLTMSGLKNQSHTLRLSRLMVRAKSLGSRVRLLEILAKAELPCRRLFLDYHGLRLLHGWMIETDTVSTEQELEYRLLIVDTLDTLPIPNKTMLKDSKVLHTIKIWSNEKDMNSSSPDDSPSDSGSATPIVGPDGVQTKPEISTITKSKQTSESMNEDYDSIRNEIHEISTKLITNWEGLPEVFRIPKRERIEQMKEHEREADRQYKALNLTDEDHYKLEAQISKRNKERFGRGGKSSNYKTNKWKQETSDRDRTKKSLKFSHKEIDKMCQDSSLTKVQRRELFAAQVAKDEADKRLAEERRIYEIKCKFYGLEATKLIPGDMPFCVNPASGQWYTEDKRKIETPPSHAHIQVPPRPMSTDPNDYDLPPMDLPPFWKFAIDTRGRIYYYHIKIRIPQWEPPIKILPLDNAGTDEPRPGTSKENDLKRKKPDDESSDDDDDDDDDGSSDSGESNAEAKEDEHWETKEIKKEINEEYDELRKSRQRERHNLLVQQRTISPRREEDRLYNQIEMKKYRENKEKIRRRKEEIKRRKRNQEGSTSDPPDTPANSLPLPIQDYLISSDEDDILKSEGGSPLLIKFGQGDKIVDELDALTKERPLKRSLPVKDRSGYKKRLKLLEEKKIVEAISLSATISSSSQKSNSSGSHKSSSSSQKSSSSEHRKSESSSSKGSGKYLARKAKEKFRGDIAGIIVHHLTPYRKESCKIGKITNNEDFKHLARKLTHFVMIKELRHCESNGQALIVTESVKNKSREFIKKYMAKYGEIYVRPLNDPEFKDILH